MCRIAGIVERYQSVESKSKLSCMLHALAHGGPDDEGIFSDNGVHLGHRRLSILDVSSLGHQPMITGDGQVVLCFNGEIYNFQEIREDLKSKGYKFHSDTDTEVILYAYQEWGVKSFSRFNGMFAFGLYDKSKKKLFLARDHAGIKPLYYSVNNQKLIFASEVRAFKSYKTNWAQNDYWKILFLAFGSVPFPHTTLEDVYMLPKGHYLVVDLNTFEYNLEEFQCLHYSEEIRDAKEAKQLIRETLSLAVKRHLISDAPIGIFLSGGIDSSLLTLIANQIGINQLRTVSVTFKEATFDESQYQQLVLNKIKSHHTSYCVDDEVFLNALEDILTAMDQPSVDGVNSYFVSKCAHENGLKAVLSGIGADEFFGGYSSFTRMKNLQMLRSIPSKFLSSGLGRIKDTFKRAHYLESKSTTGDYLFLRGIYAPGDIAKILGCSEKEVQEVVDKVMYCKDAPDKTGPNYASFLEANIYMQNQLLKDTDYMSMWHGLEVRVPYLDKELLQLVMKVSTSLKYKKKCPKYLLSNTFQHLLPQEVIFRKKYGFTFPFQLWLKKHIKKVEKYADSTSYGRETKDLFLKGDAHWSKYWSLVVLNKFQEH